MDARYFFVGDETAEVSARSIEIKPSASSWINRQSVPEILSISEWEPSEVSEAESFVRYRIIERRAEPFLFFLLLIIWFVAGHARDDGLNTPYIVVLSTLLVLFVLATVRRYYTEFRLRRLFEQMLTRIGSGTIHVSPNLDTRGGSWTARQYDEEILSLQWNEEDKTKVQDIVARQSLAGKYYRYSLWAAIISYILAIVFKALDLLSAELIFGIVSLVCVINFLLSGLYHYSRWTELNHELNALVTRLLAYLE